MYIENSPNEMHVLIGYKSYFYNSMETQNKKELLI